MGGESGGKRGKEVGQSGASRKAKWCAVQVHRVSQSGASHDAGPVVSFSCIIHIQLHHTVASYSHKSGKKEKQEGK